MNGDINLDALGNPKTNWRVVCAANRHKETGFIVCGVRHFDRIMRGQIFAQNPLNDKTKCQNPEEFKNLIWDYSWNNCDQGFLDVYGDYLSREEAAIIAGKAGQIINLDRCGSEDYIYSENLY